MFCLGSFLIIIYSLTIIIGNIGGIYVLSLPPFFL